MPVQWGTNPAVSQSVFLLRGTHAARPAAAPANQDYYYLETDTAGGTLFQSTGSAWVQVAGAVTDVDTATFAGLTDVDTAGQVDQQVYAHRSSDGKVFPLPGVVGDGASGMVLSGGLSLFGQTPDPAFPVQLDTHSWFDNVGGFWHFPSLAVGGSSVSAAGATFLNVAGILEVIGGSNVVRFTALSSLDGNFAYASGIVFTIALVATGTVEAATLQLDPTAASGAPSSGDHTKGEVIMDSAGALFVCQATGTPGTWKTVTLT